MNHRTGNLVLLALRFEHRVVRVARRHGKVVLDLEQKHPHPERDGVGGASLVFVIKSTRNDGIPIGGSGRGSVSPVGRMLHRMTGLHTFPQPSLSKTSFIRALSSLSTITGVMSGTLSATSNTASVTANVPPMLFTNVTSRLG